LDRDLKIALSEYVPGASVVAKGRLWESIGIKLPPQKALEKKYYARCPECWHVQRHLKPEELFKDGGICPVCGHNGISPNRRKELYIVPKHGFTTNLQESGKEIVFNHPEKIVASRVLFVPQKENEGPVDLYLGDSSGIYLSIKSNDDADFFVFNNGGDGRGLGFYLCDSCGIIGKERHLTKRKQATEPHLSPQGKPCSGKFSWKHLGHDFRGTATRLEFGGTNKDFRDHGFWLSLMYSLIGGVSDALDIELSDIDGVIRPIAAGGFPTQEIVLYDCVPGGAGHVKRLSNQDELIAVLEAAYQKVTNCSCGKDASCYKCLREYRNQFYHDILERKPIADYLERLLSSVKSTPETDQPYPMADADRFIGKILQESAYIDIVANEITSSASPEISSWHIAFQACASRIHEGLRIGVKTLPPKGSPLELLLPYLNLLIEGVQIYEIKNKASNPKYSLIAVTSENEMVGLRWEPNTFVTLDSQSHRLPIMHNRNVEHLSVARQEIDEWFKNNTQPVTMKQLAPTGVKTINVVAGQKVNYTSIFGSAIRKGYKKIIIVDPYLCNEHQLKCLKKFFDIIDRNADAATISVSLNTKEPNLDPKNLSKEGQRKFIKQLFEKYKWVDLTLKISPYSDRSMHARFVYILWDDDKEVLFQLDRGFDMEDQHGIARGCLIFEFSPVDDLLRSFFFR
jgi:hypothetical protein